MSKQLSGSRKDDSKKTSRGMQKVVYKGYVNWNLSEPHKRAFEKWIAGSPDIDNLVSKVLDSGYTLKLRNDEYFQCMSAGLYCIDPKSDSAGWNLSMRAGTWFKALERLLYVHYIAFNEVWVISDGSDWSDENW